MKLILAWIKKYIFHIESPSAHCMGYKYEWDTLTKDSHYSLTEEDWERIANEEVHADE